MAKLSPKAKTSSVGIKELKDQASALVEHVQKSRRPIVITKNNRPVARLVPIAEQAEQKSHDEILMELGLLSRPSTLSYKDLRLRSLNIGSAEAVAAILSDRQED